MTNSNCKVYETMFVTKQLGGVEDLTFGFERELQPRATNLETPVRQINASHFNGVLIFSTLKEMEETNTAFMGDKKCAINQETGNIYFFNGGKWLPSEEQVYKVDTLADLANIPSGVTRCVVTDLVRGGEFIYVESKKDVNDGGCVINGWVRQFTGYANVKWFGAIGNGIEDDTVALQSAINSGYPLLLPVGNYAISSELVCKSGTEIVGLVGSVIVCKDDNVKFLKLASNSIIQGVEFVGRSDANTQVGVSVDGGASLRDTFKTRVDMCKFTNIGGKGYEIINCIGDGHILSNSIFTVSKSGVDVGIQGNGLNISGCLIESCGKGLTSAGGAVTCSGNQILNNQYGVYFTQGVSGEDSKTIIDGCVISGSGTADVFVEGITNKGFMISNSSIFGKIILNSSSGVNFFKCNLKTSTIQFNQSNDNMFVGCITENIITTNDVGGIPTRNFFVDNITNAVYDPTDVGELDGGYLKVTNTEDFSIQNNQASAVSFNTVEQSLPYHNSYTKDSFYNQATKMFDFTQVVTPSSKNTIKANIQLTLNDTTAATTQENLAVYLYRVDSDSEDINTAIDLSKVTAILNSSLLAFQNNGSVYTFSGEIPRAKYKLVVKCNNLSGKKFLKQGTQVHSSLTNAPFKAEFWGI